MEENVLLTQSMLNPADMDGQHDTSERQWLPDIIKMINLVITWSTSTGWLKLSYLAQVQKDLVRMQTHNFPTFKGFEVLLLVL